MDQLAEGLAGLDLSQSTSANPSPVSVPVGGARQKMRPAHRRSSTEEEAKAESVHVTAEESQSAASVPQPQVIVWLSSQNIVTFVCNDISLQHCSNVCNILQTMFSFPHSATVSSKADKDMEKKHLTLKKLQQKVFQLF